jgi:hypothetical protein
MRGSNVSRVAKVGDRFQTEMFDPYCPKIIGSLKRSASRALNTRCIEIEMEATKRNDIPFRTTSQMLEDARILRNKLILYRLRNFGIDFETKLNIAESEMKIARLKPRTIQVNTPLMALTDDVQLKADFLKLLQSSDNVRAQDKLETLDGEIVQAIHEIILDENDQIQIFFEHGKLCLDLRVEQISEKINADRSDKKKLDARTIGTILKDLKLTTKKIKTQGQHRDKRALIFECEQLQKLFLSFALSPFPENACPHCPQNIKPNNNNGLRGDKQIYSDLDLSPNNSNYINNYAVGDVGDKQNTQTTAQAKANAFVPSLTDEEMEVF